MNKLTSAQIDFLATKKGVRKIAVQNFLDSLDESIGVSGNLTNMRDDARSYGWNAATVAAITKGVMYTFGRANIKFPTMS